MDHSNDTSGFGAALGFLAVMPVVIVIIVWVVCAVVAAIVAPDGRQLTFTLITLFILGPIGVAAAAIAQPREVPELQPAPRRVVAEGRRRFTCPRCGADNDIPQADTSYDCWRCSEHRNVKVPAATTKSAATTKKA
jgi:DNA-directed RNA polymerase subunit RPC12/RpoP